MIPRLVAIAAIGVAIFIAPPSAYSMNVERTVTTQTQSIRDEAMENLRKRRAAEANAHAYQARRSHAGHHSVRVIESGHAKY